MRHLTGADIKKQQKIERTNLINSLSGYKPANLIGTISPDGRQTNLAVFSSVVHVGADPPLLGFVQRPTGEVSRHTYENIRATGVYTINHVRQAFVERAHYTSAKFDRNVSEFAACGLTEEFLEGFAAPFVGESLVKIGLKFVEELPIKINGTIFVVGEIMHLVFPENSLLADGNLDLNLIECVCISGLDTYHRAEKIARFPYARPHELPDFDR